MVDGGMIVAVAKNQLLAIRPVRERQARRAGPYNPRHNTIDYVRDVFDNAASRIRARRLLSGAVLEAGPGGNLGPALLFLDAGCDRGVCLDLFPLLSEQAALYEELVPGSASLLAKIDYRCPATIEATDLPSESFDIAFSAVCLQHVADPGAAVGTLYRLLRPGGVTTHSIDLRDFRDLDGPLPVEFLSYPDWLWRAASSRRTPTNRWRASDWRHAFEAAGFEDVDVEPVQRAPVSEAARARMHPFFRAKSLDDLSMTLINLTATKPAAAPSRDRGAISL